MRLLNLVLFMLISSTLFAQQTIEVKPTGKLAEIKVDQDNTMAQRLNSQITEERQKAIEEVQKDFDKWNPVVLCLFSNVNFENDKNLSAKIFYVGQLRARMDANICLDASARSAVSVINQNFGPLINKFTFSDKNILRSIVTEAIDFVRKHQARYDRRWINLHGLGAFNFDGSKNENPLSEKESDWEKIDRETISNYERGFLDALQQLK